MGLRPTNAFHGGSRERHVLESAAACDNSPVLVEWLPSN